MNKGIVMELTDKHIVVMRENGRFDKISRQQQNCQPGEEIIYADTRLKWASPSIAGRSAVVAAVVFCLMVVASLTGKIGNSEVVAYVSLDINPSLEMGIDAKEKVLELRGLNPDGTELIEAMNFKGKTLETVTASLLNKAEEKSLAKGEGDIVIASTVVMNNSAVDDTKIAEKLRQQVTDHIKQTHPDQAHAYQVEAFAAPQEIREEANKSGVSMGKYSVYLNAKSNGVAITVDDLKKESIHQIVKNNAQGDVDQKSAIVQQSGVPTKETMKKLMEEEKSGELDKKLDVKKKEQLTKNSDKTNSNATKNDIKNDSKKPANSNTNGSGSNGNNPYNNSNSNMNNTSNSNNSKDKKDDKNDDQKDDKRLITPTTTVKSNTPVSTVPQGGAKPPTTSSGAARQGDNGKQTDAKKDDDKKTVDDRKQENDTKKENDNKKSVDLQRAEEKKKLAEEESKREEAKRLADQKKREEDLKKQDDKKKEQDNKPIEDDKKKDNSRKTDERGKDSNSNNSKKDADTTKKDDSSNEDAGRR